MRLTSIEILGCVCAYTHVYIWVTVTDKEFGFVNCQGKESVSL